MCHVSYKLLPNRALAVLFSQNNVSYLLINLTSTSDFPDLMSENLSNCVTVPYCSKVPTFSLKLFPRTFAGYQWMSVSTSAQDCNIGIVLKVKRLYQNTPNNVAQKIS